MVISRLASATALAGTLFFLPGLATAQTQTNGVGTPYGPVQPGAATTSPPSAAGQRESSDATDQTAAADDEITVTGSRIRVSRNIDAAVPVTTITAAQLLGTRGDVSLGDALNQLPQLRSTFSQANSTGSIGTAGLNLLDLRGLGTARTLTLVNGRRIVTAVPGSYTPDVNTIPYDLVESVDLVTGGNSAIYGSDAIAGVVNFRLRKDYEGLKLRGQGGVTSYGDRGTYLLSAVAGHNFFDGKINLTASGEYSRANSVFYKDRDYLGAFSGTPAFITSQSTSAPNRNFDGVPNTAFVPRGSVFSNRSTGGSVITSCPATATAANLTQRTNVCTGQVSPTGSPIAYTYVFQPDGSLARDSNITDLRSIGGGVLGGLGATGVEDAMLLPKNERYVANINLSGNFSPAFKPFIEATYVKVDVEQQSTQPTFTGGTLSSTFSVNNPFLSAANRATLGSILAPGATSFTLNRFNNDFGTRSEFHNRETYRGVIGVEGDISKTGNLHYEVAGNYGRTENRYRTGGNVLLANYGRAINAVVAPANYAGSNFVQNAAGQRVVCSVNADANAANDDANCVPLNLFGANRYDSRALGYTLYTSTRDQWAEEIDVTASLSGDSSGLFSLPGGPVGFAFGGEYRREDAFSGQDPVTASGATFLNPASTFDPPSVNIKELFGELRVPLLANIPFIHELTIEGAGRVSDYGGNTGSVVAWNAGGIWAPFRDLRFRGTLARSVRAPNLSNLYATAATTFVNGLTDPCDQPGGTNSGNNITANPNRTANCAAAGIPTTITFADPQSGAQLVRPWTNQSASGVAGVNQGNLGLTPEIGYSFTVGTIYTPHQVPGLSLKVEYYNIRVKNVISGLTGQAIINRCYDDTNGIDNTFCAAVFRRATGDPTTNLTFNGQTTRTIDQAQFTFPTAGTGIGFINQPFNFAQLKTRGIDFDASYARDFSENWGVNVRFQVSYVMDRLNYAYITEPNRYDRLDSTLGDPRWQGAFNAAVHSGPIELSYNARYVGKQIVSGLVYETFFASQGRPALNPDARPFVYYDPIVYHNARINLRANDKYRFFFGVDNLTNELPPYELTGTGSDAIYPNTGRFFYAGAEFKF